MEKLEQSGAGFSLTLSDGESVNAQRVVIATGISYFEYLPEELRSLPSTHCSHSADNDDLSKFAGRRILVIGGGASATDVAALLVDHGAYGGNRLASSDYFSRWARRQATFSLVAYPQSKFRLGTE